MSNRPDDVAPRVPVTFPPRSLDAWALAADSPLAAVVAYIAPLRRRIQPMTALPWCAGLRRALWQAATC